VRRPAKLSWLGLSLGALFQFALQTHMAALYLLRSVTAYLRLVSLLPRQRRTG
jgi:hypothetical protein